jgi:hypothetical protein
MAPSPPPSRPRSRPVQFLSAFRLRPSALGFVCRPWSVVRGQLSLLHSAFISPIFLSPIFLSKSFSSFSILLNRLRAIRVHFLLSRLLNLFRISDFGLRISPSVSLRLHPWLRFRSLIRAIRVNSPSGFRFHPLSFSVFRISAFGFRISPCVHPWLRSRNSDSCRAEARRRRVGPRISPASRI